MKLNTAPNPATGRKSCFFIGHREAGEALSPALSALVERHISEYGVTEFTVGNYGGFDRLAAKAVIAAKQTYPEIKLFLLLPYYPSDKSVTLSPGFDGSFFPPGMETVPKRLAIVRANRYLTDHSNFLIAYAWRPGNSKKLLEYAQAREKRELIKVSVLKKI